MFRIMAFGSVPASADRKRQREVQPPLVLNLVEPMYPAPADALAFCGTVCLVARVTRRGDVRNVRVVEGNPQLAPVAMEALRRWQFRPATVDGRPVEANYAVDFAFSIQPQPAAGKVGNEF